MVFMFITTFSASFTLFGMFKEKALSAATAAEALSYKIDAFLIFLMVILAVVALVDMVYKWFVFSRKAV
jgi:hypothetical protein